MAYEVKYSLEFNNVRNQKYRLEILELDYVGDILPLIGDENMVTIRYEEKKDEYTPILPSFMQVNLVETDTVTYENFYIQGEKKFKSRLIYDSGLPTEGVYWEGFIVPDTYTTPIKQKPYVVSFKAVCGLSLLKGTASDFNHGDYFTLRHYLEECINATENLDTADAALETGVIEVVSNDEAIDETKVGSDFFYDDDEIPLDYYEVLSRILSSFNCSIRQAPAFEGAGYNSFFSVINYGLHETSANELTFSNDLHVVNEDLLKENRGAVYNIALNTKYKYNAGLRNNAFQNTAIGSGWTRVIQSAPTTIITTSDDAFKGLYSAQLFNTTAVQQSYLRQQLTFISLNQGSRFKFSFNYKNNGGDVRYTIRIQIQDFTFRYWDASAGDWTTNINQANTVTSTPTGTWESYSDDLFIPDSVGWETRFIEVRLLCENSVLSGHWLADNVVIEPDTLNTYINNKQYRNTSSGSTKTVYPSTILGSRTLSFDTMPLTSESNIYLNGRLCDINTIFLDDALTDMRYSRYPLIDVRYESKEIETIVLTQRINDTSVESSFYEGTITPKNDTVISINDTILVDFNNFSETKKIVLISLQYDVVSNIYRFSGYLAYDGFDDVDNTIITNYQN